MAVLMERLNIFPALALFRKKSLLFSKFVPCLNWSWSSSFCFSFSLWKLMWKSHQEQSNLIMLTIWVERVFFKEFLLGVLELELDILIWSVWISNIKIFSKKLHKPMSLNKFISRRIRPWKYTNEKKMRKEIIFIFDTNMSQCSIWWIQEHTVQPLEMLK